MSETKLDRFQSITADRPVSDNVRTTSMKLSQATATVLGAGEAEQIRNFVKRLADDRAALLEAAEEALTFLTALDQLRIDGSYRPPIFDQLSDAIAKAKGEQQ